MSIENAFKKNDLFDIRLTLADKWLVWTYDEWRVYQRKYKARKSILLYSGDDVDAALKILIED